MSSSSSSKNHDTTRSNLLQCAADQDDISMPTTTFTKFLLLMLHVCPHSLLLLHSPQGSRALLPPHKHRMSFPLYILYSPW